MSSSNNGPAQTVSPNLSPISGAFDGNGALQQLYGPGGVAVPTFNPASVAITGGTIGGRSIGALVAPGPFGGLSALSARPLIPGTARSNGTDPKTTSRIRHVVAYACQDIVCQFDNITYSSGGSELVATNPITISAGLEYPKGVVTALTFAGASSATVPAGGIVLADACPLDLPAGATFWVRACVQQGGSTIWPITAQTSFLAGDYGSTPGDSIGALVDTATNAAPIVVGFSGGTHNCTTGDTVKISGATGNTAANGTWTVTVVDSTHISLNGSTGNGSYNAGSGTALGVDLTAAGSAILNGSGGVGCYSATAIYGRVAGGTAATWAAIFGDSIAAGTGDTASSAGGGWIVRGLGSAGALNQTSIPVLHKAVIGTTAAQFSGVNTTSYPVSGYSLRRRQMAIASPYAFIQFGANDATGSARTLAQLQGDILAIATSVSQRGGRAIVSTLLPFTNSTDSWASVANQSQRSGEAARQPYNTWLRAGAPIVAGVAVAVGTAGAITAGQAGHPVWKCIDPAQYVEVNTANVLALNGGYWLTNGAANYPTTDGTHPTAALHALAAQSVPLALLVPF